MAYVNPSTQNVKTCFQSNYSLPYFQREYKWEARHFSEFLNDIQSAFLLHFDPSHARKEVADYSPYFLGSIITSTEKDGKKPLIDGQQRLTSTFLLLAYLERYRRDHSILNALDLTSYLGRISFGDVDYSIEFSSSRKAIFDQYLDKSKSLDDAMAAIEDNEHIEASDRKILEALRTTEQLLSSAVREAISYFIDYVVERVLLIDISVASESEAHRVFVTMNDRGLRLGPIELLKGQILSRITDPGDIKSCHTAWVETVNTLRAIDPEEDSLFFRNLLRAKWARTIRGKSKGDEAGDFDLIGDAYHRWFEDNKARIGIQNGDDYVRFARDDIPKYADIYKFIKEAEENLVPGFEWIHYNAARKYSFQTMVLIASVKVSDSTSEWQKKIVIIARFVDLLLTTRAIEGKENNYDNLKVLSFTLANDIRDKSYDELLTHIKDEWKQNYLVIANITKVKYSRSDRSDILYILARTACYLEDKFSLTNRVGFQTYWQRDRGSRTFDIEHIFREMFDPTTMSHQHDFTDEREYRAARDLLGALILLPRSRNRSLQDKPYADKLSAYATENILAQTLCNALYQSNPNVANFVSSNPALGLRPVTDFTKNDIATRGDLYAALAKIIWQCP